MLRAAALALSAASAAAAQSDMVFIPGGAFLLGTAHPRFPQDREGPPVPQVVSPFWLDATEVPNAAFREFVEATGHVTESEQFGWSFGFEMQLSPEVNAAIESEVAGLGWWLPVPDADWRHPYGHDSSIEGLDDHPVVHVSWNDAAAFCAWRGGGARLPTEAEWEFAARGGREGLEYPWGDALLDAAGEHRANTWTGTFPTENTAEDGYRWTAPVRAYGPQNDYGLYNMAGNVWEWVGDWWSTAPPRAGAVDPQGPPRGENKVKKGGSYMCHQSYCWRYRTASRSSVTPDTAAPHLGFRCASSSVGGSGGSGGSGVGVGEGEL